MSEPNNKKNDEAVVSEVEATEETIIEVEVETEKQTDTGTEKDVKSAKSEKIEKKHKIDDTSSAASTSSDSIDNNPVSQKADITWKQYIFPNIHPDGWKFVWAAAAISVILLMIKEEIGILGLLITVFVFYFFRDPERYTPQNESLVISPADGVVNAISKCPPPPELNMGTEPVTKISIFLSLFNVHINRVPVSGTVDKLVYIPGKFLSASLDKSSEENERQLIKMTSSYKNMPIAFAQIAGLVARRILCDLKEGETVKSGQKFGLIRFGSRADVYLPKGVEPLVMCGQETVAGETVLADLSTCKGNKGDKK